MNKNDEYDFYDEDIDSSEGAIGFELNVDFEDDIEFDSEDEEIEYWTNLYNSICPRIEDPQEMEKNIISSLQDARRNDYYKERFDAGLLILAINKDNLHSYLGTKDEYDDEMYDLYDIYNENGINLRNNLVVVEFGYRVIDIIPVKKIVAKYFSDYTEDIYMKDIEEYNKDVKEAATLYERRHIAYKKWWEGTELKREGLIKEAAEALEISVENRVHKMPIEDIFTSLAHCYRLLHDVPNEIRVLNIAVAETNNPKFERALQRALKKM
ncbi:MAG: hypothetical protein IKA19_04435 [Muribaculaceae bacterium]|nr:hypothetical protein [Muribaculaceae bacterium]